MTTTSFPTGASGPATRRGAWARRLVRGRADTARWERPATLGLLAATAVLYLVGLGANGWGNAFYAAAVQAGSESWEAFFYGSSDAANSITVDKPPAFLWVMELSVRLFGLNSWAILVPQAIMGVLSVALLVSIVRRRFSAGAALVAGAVLATTPVATLMFRFDNPDALLVLLMLASIWLVLRGVETGRLRYVVWAGVAIGFAFLTKQLQAFLILPVLVGVYLYAARMPVWRRIWHLLVAAAAIVVSAGWWVAIVELVPSGSRPYVGGSQTDSFLELTFGYNGLGRVTGDETGSVTGGGGGGGGFGGTRSGEMWGSTGITRLFGSEFAGQVAWLLPAALVLLVLAVALVGVRRRTSPQLATVVTLGGSLLVTGLVFSFMGGIFHPYYTIALAPYIAGLVGIGAALVWQHRARLWVRIVGAVTVLGTAAWQWALLSEATSWQPWIKWVVAVAAVVSAVFLLLPWVVGARRPATGAVADGRGERSLRVVLLASVLVAGLLGPTAWSIATVSTAHTGSLPSAGPTVARTGFGGMGGGGGFGGRGGPGNAQFGGAGAPGGTAGSPGGTAGAPGGAAGGAPGAPAGGTSGGAAGGGAGAPSGGTGGGAGTAGGGAGATGGGGRASTGGAAPEGAGRNGRTGGMGSLLGGDATVSTALRKALEADASDYTWVAATIGSNSAATYQLATEEPVMPIGGFNGSDPSPTLAQFERYVAAGEIHWFIAGEVGRSNGGSDASSAISSWVESHFTAQTIGGVTVYDLTAEQ